MAILTLIQDDMWRLWRFGGVVDVTGFPRAW